jgi:hypothetical protein
VRFVDDAEDGEGGDVIGVGEPLIICVSVQECDLAGGIVPNEVPLVFRIVLTEAGTGDDPILLAGAKGNRAQEPRCSGTAGESVRMLCR